MNAAAQDIKLEASWLNQLKNEFQQGYMLKLKSFLVEQKQQGKVIYPPGQDIFTAFRSTPFENVKVVIIGQDPYHGPNQAHGLSFSVRPDVRIPPSLRNIFAEQARDLGIQNGAHGSLTQWAEQGVLLLNSVLTVEAHKAASHQGKGWEIFTDQVIAALNQQREHIVFMCWGNYAQKKAQYIDQSKHLVLKSVHPSPLSAHRGFIGCGHFSKANEYLKANCIEPIDWQLL